MITFTTKTHKPKAHKFKKWFYLYALTLVLIAFKVNTAFSAAEEKISNNIKAYIQNIRSVAISFEQSDTGGNKAKGILVIDKPYKFRVNYFAPSPLLIVGNKNYISVYDYEMENLSRVSAKENIFNFLLVDRIKFDNQFEILEAKESVNHYKVKLIHLITTQFFSIKK